MRLFPALLVCATALLAAPPSTPKQPPPPRSLRIPISFPEETEPLTVKPADFRVALEGSRAAGRVTRVRSPKDDLMLLVVLDLAGDFSLIDPARASLAQELKNLPPSTWVGVMRAQDGLQVLLDPTADREKSTAAISTAPVTGKAGLLDSIETVVRLADGVAAKAGVRVSVLYVTDSNVRNYREDFTNPVINSSDSRDLSRRFPEGLIREKVSKLSETLAGLQTPVFIAHLWYTSEALNQAYQTGLMQLATATGGRAGFCRSATEIPGLIARTVAAAQAQYSLQVQLPHKVPSVVNLSLESGDRRLEYRSRFVLR